MMTLTKAEIDAMPNAGRDVSNAMQTNAHPCACQIAQQFMPDINGFASVYGGILWYPVVGNPLPWYKKLIGKVLYISQDGRHIREGWSTAESSW